MKSLWNSKEAARFKDDPLGMRVYTSQLLGREPDLVLHGGGNTSLKIHERNFFGESEYILYVKGSGWDLGTIQKEGFAPVKMSVLLKMAEFEKLSDSQMVRLQRAAMTNPNAPTPSVEAILNAIIPTTHVEHTHPDAILAVCNTPGGEKRIREIYGQRVIVIPYVMPGFILGRKVYEMTRGIDWQKYEGMVLLNHGMFTFHNDAKTSYERMIQLVSEAEDYLRRKKAFSISTKGYKKSDLSSADLLMLTKIRQRVSQARQLPTLSHFKRTKESVAYASLPGIERIATRGPLTPDHVLRTKRIPLVIKNDFESDLRKFMKEYTAYFKRNAQHGQTQLDPAPRWAVWSKRGAFCFGLTVKDLQICSDIADHTMRTIQQSEKLGGWQALSEKDIFDVEYWELEQAKLKLSSKTVSFQGKIVLVSGAASGIGKACVESLIKQGAAIVALDINPKIKEIFKNPQVLALVCDLTHADEIRRSINLAIENFGGLDIVISNAGIFPPGEHLEKANDQTWQKSLDINLTSHRLLIKECIPYLANGLDPAIIIIASKNVPAPGPGASAYSVAKAGLTQLGRVAALELASKGIRVNMLHPNQVFDTAIWTKDVLDNRAKHYGISVEEYKKSNLLKVEITSKDVAELALAMAGPLFSKTTGAQVPIDGGNDRVI